MCFASDLRGDRLHEASYVSPRRVDKDQLVSFSKGVKKIVSDPAAIAAVEDILSKAHGFNIVDTRGCYVLDAQDADVNASSSTGLIMPVMTDAAVAKLAQGLEKIVEKEAAKDDIRKEVLEEEVSEPVPMKAARKPYTPTAEERLQHEATHCPYRSWCEHCVAGVGPDSRHEHMKHADGIAHIEFDYAAGSGKASDPESQITLITASESQHGGALRL